MRVTDPHVLRVFTEKGGVEVQRGNARSGAHRQRSEVRDAAQGLLYEGDIHLRTTEIHQ